MEKIGRNQPCPCGSGEKYKRCHGNPAQRHPLPQKNGLQKEIQEAMRRRDAEELVRVEQQGEGRPIISAVVKSQRVVAVGNKIYHSNEWKFFADFLSDYLKTVMGTDWGNIELAKEWDERHPILRWYHGHCLMQRAGKRQMDGTYSAVPTGVVNCFLGLAYGLYLLSHNVELQGRLVNRLKDIGNFQGAYYEVIVASCLIRAGFKLTLEDEADKRGEAL